VTNVRITAQKILNLELIAQELPIWSDIERVFGVLTKEIPLAVL